MRILMVIPLMVAAAGLAPAVQDPKPAARWQDDPVCHMVFFAVLEGLYTDGVPTEVVDLVVPKETVEHSFVLKCPLCHPVFEAFRLYQGRKPFVLDPDKGDTFGKSKVTPETIAALKAGDVFTRVKAMGGLIQPWIARRMALMRLNEKEALEWRQKLVQRAREGAERFKELKATKGTVYQKEWQFYAGCQACEAVERVVGEK